MAEWPSELPDKLLQDGFSKTYPDNTIRTEMSVGPPKMRRRSTAGITPIRGRQVMTTSELSTFTTFYETTLGYGSTVFDWLDPITQATASFRFTSPPTVIPTGGADFYVELNLEIMP